MSASLRLLARGIGVRGSGRRQIIGCSSPRRCFASSSDLGLDITGHPTFASKTVPGPSGLPSRADMLRRLNLSSKENPYDVLIVGGGATGAGCALDAATREGNLKVACIERGDFASETSSRSTKLIWAGIRYLATASVSLLSPRLFTNPIETAEDFIGELKMVMNCHRERRYMTEKQRHLTNWVPIAVPFSEWHVSPPPFNHKLFGFFPVLAPLVFKIYDGMSGFSCPSSYVMGKEKARRLFPQLSGRMIKYCAVFFEAQHNDSRTNIAIALSAAEHGTDIANYLEMTGVLWEGKKAVGVTARDRMTNQEMKIWANKIVFAGGPFTDGMRAMEHEGATSSESAKIEDGDDGEEPYDPVHPVVAKVKKPKDMIPAVSGGAGTHLVLPGYYSPSSMGLLDYNTSDGRFLFFLPWQKHTLVGTTDTKSDAKTLPEPPEDEVQWLLNECSKYLSRDLRVRRSDVLSAWQGWRPLAADPHAPPCAPVSRDHVISENPTTGIIFIAGGKWTTWREMAEETIDRVVGENGPKSTTLDQVLFGGEGWSHNLPIKLIQKYGMSHDTAEHLAKTYGGRAFEVCEMSNPTGKNWPRFGVPLVQNYPYIDGEVRWACREYACTVEDVLSRRTRLAFLNKDAALSALPLVADIMAEELGWSADAKAEQIAAARAYVESYAGRIPKKQGSSLREATYEDLRDIFDSLDRDGNGFLDRFEIGEAASVLGFPLSSAELSKAFDKMNVSKTGRVTFEEFAEYWNVDSYLKQQLTKELGLGGKKAQDIKELGGGVFLG